MTDPIAIVGLACEYPGASSPAELWENVLAGRRSFRRMPDCRLRLEDYLSDDPDVEDATYSGQAALITDYEFDRSRFRVVGTTYRSADLAHWLALDVASRALADGGFPDGDGLPKDLVGVLVGNSLTGEFSRANILRLRWPYVRRTVDAVLARRDWSPADRALLLTDLEEQFKAPFPPVGDETLAGGLSNTIAGRICNYFDLRGGGYTVDGACASSLLAVATACSSLTAGDLDVALAGGVDLSLDPFELIGFAKVGALARQEMRVYDSRSAGFWPGEGCGFVVLMRMSDAVAQGRRIYATIRGWGISSDGSGGITRPEVEGQKLALSRAYRRTGFGVDTVTYFEGHGTGTGVGDATELRTVIEARRESSAAGPPATIGSVKANIGHTKAAAGVAGLLKATLALHHQVLPPSVGWEQPHAELTADGASIRLLRQGEAWPEDQPLRAAVSAMGFGGINAHLALEGVAPTPRKALDDHERVLLSSAQDAELFLFSAPSIEVLEQQVRRVAALAGRLSLAELTDLAAHLAKSVESGPARAAVVASRPERLQRSLETLAGWLAEGTETRLDVDGGILLGSGTEQPSIGLLFPGQGSAATLTGGAWRHRFDFIRDMYDEAALPQAADVVATEVAHPAIVTSSLAGLAMLERLGLEAAVGIGHSMGELVAYHWAGVYDRHVLWRLARARGQAIATHGRTGGAMAGITAPQQVVEGLIGDLPAVISGLNSPNQTVVSGEAAAVEAVAARAHEAGLKAVRLPVSHAFHSPLVADAAAVLTQALEQERLQRPERLIASTITGGLLEGNEDLCSLLAEQMTNPVRLMQAVEAAAIKVDLWIEVGPGHVLRGIVGNLVERPIVSLDAGGDSLKDLLRAVGAAFVLGAPVHIEALFDDRFARPFDLDWDPQFFVNPCELAPLPDGQLPVHRMRVGDDSEDEDAANGEGEGAGEPSEAASALEVMRQLAADRAELPLEVVKAGDRLLQDLHFSSIAVASLVADAARALKLPQPAAPTDYANATIGEVAAALDELARTGVGQSTHAAEAIPAGVDSWVRTFAVELVERALPPPPVQEGTGEWQIVAPADHPLRDSLLQALTTSVPGRGVVVCLPEDNQEHVPLLLEATRLVLEDPKDCRFVMVQHDNGAGGWARTLHLELPQVTTCVVNLPAGQPIAVDWIVAEAQAASGYSEAHYDAAGTRRVPVLKHLPATDSQAASPLGPDDVLLVTGGGKGIAAECALDLARQYHVRLGILGRSRPEDDAELGATLHRMTASGATFRYVPADVTDAAAVRAAIAEIEQKLGPVTAVLHGAGANVPQPISALDAAGVLRTLGPKVDGLRNVLAAVDPARLRLLVTFGSIIARTGMHGEADYAIANERLSRLTEQWQHAHPHCRSLAVEWSVWSGIGMGERLGRIDALKQQGITPITPDEGVSILRRLITSPPPCTAVVVSGRLSDSPTLRFDRPQLPLLRFLEQPRVFIPGVELVVDVTLSLDTDPYLLDHAYQDVPLLPAVMGLEAMAQVSTVLLGTTELPVFENVRLTRPIAVPAGTTRTIRLAALVRRPNEVEVVLRSDETGFQADHFRATCRFGNVDVGEPTLAPPSSLLAPSERVPLDPDRDLYGKILFHRGRFRRVRGYRQLSATQCVAELSPDGDARWFVGYLPDRLLLGDPAVRDATIHAIQACIPHGTILPVGVERVVPATHWASESYCVHARERLRDGDRFVYDVEVTAADGHVCERWEGLELRRVAHAAPGTRWAAPPPRSPSSVTASPATTSPRQNLSPQRPRTAER
jgi:enediyne polyketide synthase